MNAPRLPQTFRLALGLILAYAGVTAHAAHSHKGYFPGGYVDARNCLICHKNAATEVMGTVHYLWRTENSKVEYPGGGAHGMLDRACGLVGSSAMVNFGEHCGRCHIGDTPPLPDPATGTYSYAQKVGLDCLLCHADAGKYDLNGDGKAELGELAEDRPRGYDAKLGRETFFHDHSTQAAESVGKSVSNDACLRCHYHGQGDLGYKRGTPYKPTDDVHAAKGVLCTTCHLVVKHKMVRGNRVTDMFANEMPMVDLKCEDCHSDAPHDNPCLNIHTAQVGCETCHIPWVAGAQRRVWAPTYGVPRGAEAQVPKYKPSSKKWEPYTAYDTKLVSPSYRWFAGGASMLAEPIATAGAFNMQPATRTTTGAKILPFRKFISGLPMDACGIPGMRGFNARYTMKGAMEQMAPALKKMGMMRQEGLKPQESAMLSQFPNMLYFDRAEYFASGNLSASISLGMAKLGVLMQGQNPSGMPRAQLLQMGSQMWSGQIAGLDLPDTPYAPGYVADRNPTTATGSFITVSHAIKRKGALTCKDCHVTNGRLNFKELGYSSTEQKRLETLLGSSVTSTR